MNEKVAPVSAININMAPALVINQEIAQVSGINLKMACQFLAIYLEIAAVIVVNQHVSDQRCGVKM